MSWVEKTSNPSLTFQECFLRAKEEIMDSHNVVSNQKNNEQFDIQVSGELMGFVASRYALAKGEKLDNGDAITAYEQCAEALQYSLLGFLDEIKTNIKNSDREDTLDHICEETVLMLDSVIPEWVSGPDKAIRKP